MLIPAQSVDIRPIRLYDPLADALGAVEGGVFDYTYEDVVRLAGHSCPTVAGAFLMLSRGLEALFGPELPIRGNVRVTFRESVEEGTTGVVAAIASFVTGAAGTGGFAGIGGRYGRRGLMAFGVPMEGSMALERIDTGALVVLDYDPSPIPLDPLTAQWMGDVVSGGADLSRRSAFAEGWQKRVRAILQRPDLVSCRAITGGER